MGYNCHRGVFIMNLKKQIDDYLPYNEQEEKDKEVFLKYINFFDDVLTRDNEFGHFTGSAFVVNQTRDKVLMVHHNIYNSWAWTGGHADGEEDLLAVALREVQEETGIKNINPISKDIFVIDALPQKGHIKRSKFVSAHTHLSVVYLVEANDDEPLVIKLDENSNVKWIPINEVILHSNEPHMQTTYQKAIDKLNDFL